MVRTPQRSPTGASVADWRGAALHAPMFAPLRPLLDRLPAGRFPALGDLDRLIPAGTKSAGGALLRFVPPGPASKDFDTQYEVRVFRRGEVPTRASDWHDLFNALVWLSFPRTKALLNRLHVEQLEARRGELLRGTARDVLTLFDEGGVIVASADARVATLLHESRWKELFWRRRAEFLSSVSCFVFGHAIYEKALQPYKGVTAKALVVDVGAEFLRSAPQSQLLELDARAYAYFAAPDALASTRSLPPLPVLGVPGWDPANAVESYYDDTRHFRSGRGLGDERDPKSAAEPQ
jgi:hypothetical protein